MRAEPGSAEPRRLILLRHGQTSWNALQRVQGQLDSELDDVGHRQAADVATVLARRGPSVLWSSDSARARATAAYVAKETGLDAVHDARLREYFLADRQGLTHTEYTALAPEEFARFRRGDFGVVPGGETAEQVSARVAAAVRDVLGQLAPGELAVVVSHGAAIRDAVPVLLGRPVARPAVLYGLDNCGWAELDQADLSEPMRMSAYNRVASS